MPRLIFAFFAALVLAPSARAMSQDDSFLAAREAFRVGDAVKLERYAQTLNGYVLESYAAYWLLRLRLGEAAPAEIQAQIARLKDGPLGDRLRADWLKLLGMRQQWDLFDAEYPQLVESDTELRCYLLQSRLRAGGAEAVSQGRALWATGRDLPESCNAAFNTLIQRQHLDADDVWERVRLALEAGNTGVARRVADYLPGQDPLDARALAAITVNAQAFLDKKVFDLKSRGGRETVMFAVHRLARTSPPLAAQQWLKLGERFSEAERKYIWGLLAVNAAQRHDPNALAWFARAGNLTDLQLAWKARTALRVRSWPDVLAAVDAMSAKEREDPAWRYWKARALKAQGHAAEAQALLTPIAGDFSFYGQLAAEELGGRTQSPVATYKPGKDEVAAIGKLPGLQRALAFYRLNLRFEGNREWNWTVRTLGDKELLAAAELARRHEIYDRAINTAERTRELHDFSLRYLAPYRDVLKGYAGQQQLDEAWVYGLMRQESRFIVNAKSSAGASGLMQLMPATARWVAGKLGLRNFSGTQTTEIETNINLGTWYMKHVLETLDNHPVLASAAYNAGPGRARAWRGEGPMEAAIYTESIPFNETRDYVKKVMSAATYYGHQFGHTLTSLKQRIGIIAPRQRDAEKTDEPGG